MAEKCNILVCRGILIYLYIALPICSRLLLHALCLELSTIGTCSSLSYYSHSLSCLHHYSPVLARKLYGLNITQTTLLPLSRLNNTTPCSHHRLQHQKSCNYQNPILKHTFIVKYISNSKYKAEKNCTYRIFSLF